MRGGSIDFFFNDTATTEIYTLSLHDALPIWSVHRVSPARSHASVWHGRGAAAQHVGSGSSQTFRSSRGGTIDRKSTRLNSSHANISYAVFCLKKKQHTN